MKGFGARLRAAREARGLSQNALAQLLPGEVSQGAVSYWESDRNTPSVENLHDLCDVLAVSADWLLGRTDTEPARAATKLAREVATLQPEQRRLLEKLLPYLKR